MTVSRSKRTAVGGLEDDVRVALEPYWRIVLAVSGGIDSMVLLDVVSRVARERIYAVATFDHATGDHARRATELVREAVWGLRLPSVTGRAAEGGAHDEDTLRRARLGFLRSVATSMKASLVTAHTKDDQIETVCMRILRDAGARGLSGMYAPSDVVRPLLDTTREQICDHALDHDVPYVEDPSNASARYFRNRVRNDLLPAIGRIRPEFGEDLLELARRAATWRASLEEVVDALDWRREEDGSLSVGADPLIHLDSTELRTLWPALGARGGIRFDRRGTERLALFTTTSTTGATMQLSGGFEVRRERQRFVLRRR